MRPISEDFMFAIMQKNALDKNDLKHFRLLRKLIVKEYFRLYIWAHYYEKYSALNSINILRLMEFEYKSSSLLYQIYYGEK